MGLFEAEDPAAAADAAEAGAGSTGPIAGAGVGMVPRPEEGMLEVGG